MKRTALLLVILCACHGHAHADRGVVGRIGSAAAALQAADCDEETEMERYEAGELSETRDAETLPHRIKVTHFCADDADVDAAFDWLNRAEARFLELFESSIAVTDGTGKTLHVVVGDGNALCRDYGFSGCGDIDWGRAYQTCRTSEDVGPEPPEDCEESGVTFMDVDPDEAGWFRNIVHEYAHLLDYTYMYKDFHYRTWGGGLTDWWREGMPEYVQMSLRESLSLEHRPDRVRTHRGQSVSGPAGIASRRSLVSTVSSQNGMDVYSSGRALVRYLAEEDNTMLERAARLLRGSVWRDTDGLTTWWRLSNRMVRKHAEGYAEWNTRNGASHDNDGGGTIEIEGDTMLDQFLAHRSVRTETLMAWINAVCNQEDDNERRICRTDNENEGFNLNGVPASDETQCYLGETISSISYRSKDKWLPYVREHWDREEWADECAPDEDG